MLCRFAGNMSSHIGEFLDRSSSVSRSFREETMTDILVGGLVAMRPFGVVVDFSDEKNTGADMEWDFVRADGSTRFSLLIQAKRLYGSGSTWSRRSYPEIFHRVGGKKSGRIQSSALVSEARSRSATYPLYLFYTNKSVCDAASRARKRIDPLSFVCGSVVDSLVCDKISGSLSATKASSLKVIQPHMFPMRRLLCGVQRILRINKINLSAMANFVSGSGSTTIISTELTPEHVYHRLVDAVGDSTLVPQPVYGRAISDERAKVELPARHRITFVSPSMGYDREVYDRSE